ncbi:hypothetical protein [Ethanoligenens harbinense]|uniref:Condensation domain-containing protein n=1 Tax=Ethanoligenens harbinense (strain DSM 18485 / JCM 12961 / CGMCC 1.5033 / YUAN-3) TaxID=663278 RepID=E6U6X1_ETHHY|nr:hypothetical protein [Ethanoligenens harbinense]ADU26938.1 hypothetical protein Ethha_1401 [Ethanoligenens harbinense YUAN-3]AVQ96031.1 hypothetical protein CXQ68_07220 [Ethanoligenens harbinense YUAN-3]AYF38692.1 hypothetical protein CXP51_07090 [Ethanoligenens harbinense]AYF41439.1 hypothetical protein CN246_07230 [Ethanoligenens harbinense]QCN92273.1 hypothetical protein DRA42_07250 [Ethanoligenens harbinense]
MRQFHHNQRHFQQSASLPRISAQAWDIEQYAECAVQKRHDGQVRCAVYFRGNLKLERLKRAVLLSLHALPQLQGRYIPDDNLPYWQIHDSDISDLFSMVTTNCTDDEVMSFLSDRTDGFRGPQIRFKLVRGQARDTLCIILNRMICDEAGMKEYLYLLGHIYSDLHAASFQAPQPEKLYMQRVLRALPPIARLKAAFRRQPVLNIPAVKQSFPLSGVAEVPFIVTNTLPVSRYQALARFAVYRHVGVDEVLLTAYIRAVYAMLRERPGGPFPVVCQTDLRRFLPWGTGRAACSLSLPLLFVSPAKLPSDFHQTLMLVHNRLSMLHTLSAVIENAKALGYFPFSAKHAQEHLASVSLPHYLFNHIGKIDGSRLVFGDVDINDAYITGPIYNQPNIALHTTVYEDSLTLSCNLTGTRDDWATCKYFLALLIRELPTEP